MGPKLKVFISMDLHFSRSLLITLSLVTSEVVDLIIPGSSVELGKIKNANQG